MSTVDPRAETTTRSRRPRGSVGALMVVLCGALGALLAGFAIGWGVMSILDGIRVREINPVDSWTDGEGVTFWILVAGIVAALVARGIYWSGVRRYRGDDTQTNGLAWLFLAGAAGGCLGGSRSLTPALEVGRSTYLGTSDEWGPGAWSWYYLPIWLPALLLTLAVLILVGSLVADRREKRVDRRTKREAAQAEVPADSSGERTARIADEPLDADAGVVFDTAPADAGFIADGAPDPDDGPAWGTPQMPDTTRNRGRHFAD